MKEEENYGLLYKSENYTGPLAQTARMGVKFSNDIFLMMSFLKQHNIPYREEDLEDGPMERGLRIKRDNHSNNNRQLSD